MGVFIISIVGLLSVAIDNVFADAVEVQTNGSSFEMREKYVLQDKVKKHAYLTYFDELLEKYKEKLPKEEKVYTVETRQDMLEVVKDVEVTFPEQFEIRSKYFSPKDLKVEYEKTLEFYLAESIKNHQTLLNYKKNVRGNKVVFINQTNGYTAKQIVAALDEYSDYLARQFKDENVEQSILNLYDFIYENFKYKANSIPTMLVGNLSNGEMACNGFSRLAYEVLNKMGFKTEIRGGFSHFWNVTKLDNGKQITFDVTTDILLKQKYKTLGNDSKDHINNTASVNIYNAEYRDWQYKEVGAYEFDLLKESNKQAF